MGSTSIRWGPARLIQLCRLPGRRPIRARRRVLRFDTGRQRLRVQRTHARDVSRQSHARARGVDRRRRRSREPAVESAARHLLAGIGDAVGAGVAAGHDGDDVVLLDRIAASSPDAAASLRFGLDGKLYVALDDGGHPLLAGDLASFNGKILRMNPDGTTPDDQAGATPVYSYGYRAPRALD